MNNTLNIYLSKMEKYLKRLPAADRIDIVNELKSEMSEQLASGVSAEEIVSKLGKPKALARAYLAEEFLKMKKFSWKKFAMVFSFYSYAGIGSIFILPITSCLAIALIISGILLPVAGAVKLIAHFFGTEMPFIAFTLGGFSANAIQFFLISIGAGIILFFVGWLFWKLTVLFIKSVGKHKHLTDKVRSEN